MNSLHENEFYAKPLILELNRLGMTAIVEQTGGGTATLSVQNDASHERILAGPGSYDWNNAGISVFTTEEFCIGEDAYDNNDELKDYDPESVPANVGDSIEAIALIIKAEYDKLNSDKKEVA